jgi:hypothetical protein
MESRNEIGVGIAIETRNRHNDGKADCDADTDRDPDDFRTYGHCPGFQREMPSSGLLAEA